MDEETGRDAPLDGLARDAPATFPISAPLAMGHGIPMNMDG